MAVSSIMKHFADLSTCKLWRYNSGFGNYRFLKRNNRVVDKENIVDKNFTINIIRCKKLATTVSILRNVTRSLIRWKQVSTTAVTTYFAAVVLTYFRYRPRSLVTYFRLTKDRITFFGSEKLSRGSCILTELTCTTISVYGASFCISLLFVSFEHQVICIGIFAGKSKSILFSLKFI